MKTKYTNRNLQGFKQDKQAPRSNQIGFTLIELIVAIVVISVLVALAAPSFTSVLRNNALTSNANKFVTAFSLARSEAVTRNGPVSICTKSTVDPATCDNGAPWHNGWLVFSDPDVDGVFDAGEVLIRNFDELSSSQTLTPSAALGSVTYLANGRTNRPTSAAELVLYLCSRDAQTNNDTERSRTLNLNAAGRVRIVEGSVTCPAS